MRSKPTTDPEIALEFALEDAISALAKAIRDVASVRRNAVHDLGWRPSRREMVSGWGYRPCHYLRRTPEDAPRRDK
jgi:hypothetical protein